MQIMRGTFFQKGMRGKRPGALLRRLHRPFYEGQLAGYLRYLHEKEAATRLDTTPSRPIEIDYPVPTTRGDRVIAGMIAGGCFICTSYVAIRVIYRPDASEMEWGAHSSIFYMICGVSLGLFVIFGYVCLRVVFGK